MSTWRWTLDDDAADVSAGSGELFNKRMLETADNAGNILITVPFGTVKDVFFYSDAGQPGNAAWPAGAWEFDIDVVLANARITAEVFLNRVAADGTVIENYGPGTSPQTLGSVAVVHFNGTTVAQVAAPLPDSAHRVRLGIKLTHNGSPGSQDIRIGFGNPAVHFLAVPIQVIPQPHRPIGTGAAVVGSAVGAAVGPSGTAAAVSGSVVMAGIAPDGSPVALAGDGTPAAVVASGTAAAIALSAGMAESGKPSATPAPVGPTATPAVIAPIATAAAIVGSGQGA